MISVILPKLSQTMDHGTIVRWLKSEGDYIHQEEPLLEVETDKAIVVVEAPGTGTLGKILHGEDEKVPIAHVIAYILSPGERPPDDWSLAVDGEEGAAAVEREHTLEEKASPRTAAMAGSQSILRGSSTAISPRAKRLAQDRDVDLTKVVGTGPGGRIVEQDVLRLLQTGAAQASQWLVPGLIERLAAERLTASFATTPHFYLSLEARATELVALHALLLPTIEEEAGVHLTYTDLLVALVSRSLRKHPRLNASWDGDRIKLFTHIGIGVAMAVEEGLVVPVLMDADKMTIAKIASERSALASRAAAGKLALEDMQAGTFTVTNLGMFGVDDFAAIINPPQSAILAVGRIAERPVVQDGKVVATPTIRLTLSVDHRVASGAEGARFLATLSAAIEHPELE